MKFDSNLGFILLALFLILYALMALGVTFGGLDVIVAIVALAAGILLLINR
jgi:hypothetical protein